MASMRSLIQRMLLFATWYKEINNANRPNPIRICAGRGSSGGDAAGAADEAVPKPRGCSQANWMDPSGELSTGTNDLRFRPGRRLHRWPVAGGFCFSGQEHI